MKNKAIIAIICIMMITACGKAGVQVSDGTLVPSTTLPSSSTPLDVIQEIPPETLPTPVHVASPTPETPARYFRGYYASDVLMHPDGSRLYVPCYHSSNLLVIEVSTNRIVESIDLSGAGPFGMYPIDASIVPDGSKVVLGDQFSGQIALINTESNEVEEFLDVGVNGAVVSSVEVTPDGKHAYVALERDWVPVIDMESFTTVDTIAVDPGIQITLIGFSSEEGGMAFLVSPTHGGTVYVVDTDSREIIHRIDLHLSGNMHPASIAVAPGDAELYLTSGFNEGGTERPDVGVNRVFVIDPFAGELVDAIEVLGGPHGIALSPDGQTAYVSTFAAEKIVALDLSERVVIGEFDWNGVLSGEASYKRYDLRKFAILPDGKTGYLVSWDGGVLILLDLLALRATDIIDLNPALGAEPVDIVITPDGAKAYVSVWGRFTPGGERHWVGVIDTQTNQVIKQIRIGGMPRHMDINPDGQFVYVASSPFVYVIDTQIDEVAAEIIVSGHEISLNDVAVEPNQNKLYVAYTAGDQPGGVFVVDLEAGTVIGNIAVKWRPNAVAVSQDGSQLYVNCILGPHDQGALAVVDTLTDEVLSVIDPPEGANEPEVGTFTSPLALTSDGKHIYWTTGWKWVNVVEADTNRILRTLDVEVPLPGLPIAPSGIAFISDLSMAYISCLDAGFVASWDIEEGEFAAVMRVGFNPTGIVVTADDQNAYVINMLSEDISVIDLNTHEVVEVIQLTPPPLE